MSHDDAKRALIAKVHRAVIDEYWKKTAGVVNVYEMIKATRKMTGLDIEKEAKKLGARDFEEILKAYPYFFKTSGFKWEAIRTFEVQAICGPIEGRDAERDLEERHRRRMPLASRLSYRQRDSHDAGPSRRGDDRRSRSPNMMRRNARIFFGERGSGRDNRNRRYEREYSNDSRSNYRRDSRERSPIEREQERRRGYSSSSSSDEWRDSRERENYGNSGSHVERGRFGDHEERRVVQRSRRESFESSNSRSRRYRRDSREPIPTSPIRDDERGSLRFRFDQNFRYNASQAQRGRYVDQNERRVDQGNESDDRRKRKFQEDKMLPRDQKIARRVDLEADIEFAGITYSPLSRSMPFKRSSLEILPEPCKFRASLKHNWVNNKLVGCRRMVERARILKIRRDYFASLVLPEDLGRYEQMMDEIQVAVECYSQRHPICFYNVGDGCLVKLLDRKWHRGFVMARDGSANDYKMIVMAVDVGIQANVHFNRVVPLPKCLSKINSMGLSVKLAEDGWRDARVLMNIDFTVDSATPDHVLIRLRRQD